MSTILMLKQFSGISIWGMGKWESKTLYFILLTLTRFENLEALKDEKLILYVGANTDGEDGVVLMKKCPDW